MILCRQDTSADDVGGMHASKAILTERGGMTSHAAVVGRGEGGEGLGKQASQLIMCVGFWEGTEVCAAIARARTAKEALPMHALRRLRAGGASPACAAARRCPWMLRTKWVGDEVNRHSAG